MLDAPALTEQDAAPFRALDEALRTSGPEAALNRLIGLLTDRGESRALLDALLLKARHELGLPLVQVGSLNDVPEPTRSKYEERYVDAIRTVGGRLLDSGDIPAAWPYFRAIGEPELVSKAIDAFSPGESDERLGPIVEVAFNQGANPRRGFELILGHYGTCSAITAFEHLPHDEATRVACAEMLIRQLHAHLTESLRAEIAHRGQPLPAAGTPISGLVAGRDWLFSDDAYHIDVSHLAATVRLAPLVSDPATIALAIGLTDYGRRLSPRHRYEGEVPFENTYEDHAVYLRALVGEGVEEAIAHFRSKLGPSDPDGRDASPAAQVLVGLLVRLGRLDEAIELAADRLGDLPDSALMCPGVATLCQKAGQPDRLARIARDHGNLVNYTAALLQTGPLDPPA